MSRYIVSGKIPLPEIVKTVKASLHLWSEKEIENLCKLLPKIDNGRKTRHKKQQAAGVKLKKKQTEKK
ncbi:MAG: hypothetical protein DMG65_20315 [Candidatus Angelobacter sp. Gp1-AA117]|nr:MAG: hypothetical protein DMG65_20315 [Candidatus Angelobacter sp. Gp1-AA117]